MATSKLRLSVAKIKRAKRNLRKLQKQKQYSLRDMAKMLGDKVTFQTLGRFIKEKDYVPKDEDVCRLLDLYADPNPYRGLPRWYNRTPEALEYWNSTRGRIKDMYNEAKAQSRSR